MPQRTLYSIQKLYFLPNKPLIIYCANIHWLNRKLYVDFHYIANIVFAENVIQGVKKETNCFDVMKGINVSLVALIKAYSKYYLLWEYIYLYLFAQF